MLPGASAPARSSGLTRDGQPVSWRPAHRQGRRLRRLRRPRRATTRALRDRHDAPAITGGRRDGRRRGPRDRHVEHRRAVDLAGRVRPHDHARRRGPDTARSPITSVELTGLSPTRLPLPRDVGRRARATAPRSARRPAASSPRRPARSSTTGRPSSPAGDQTDATPGRPSAGSDGEVSSSRRGRGVRRLGLPGRLGTALLGHRRQRPPRAARCSPNGAATNRRLLRRRASLEFTRDLPAGERPGVGFGDDLSDFPYGGVHDRRRRHAVQLYAHTSGIRPEQLDAAGRRHAVVPHRFRIEWNAPTVCSTSTARSW